ncbi:invertase [Glutamicibacter sp. BW78]|uniref:recombinase family protein n=1 Tax=Glutamicibacter sp. BW78 TaxID=2024403 RepID=UPI000BB7AA7E|nr:recombinase family protein [Glutamicibacter sp. BW78]PCC26519.1 invertase [Glutamicibacter sp. BW78]
MALIGYARVSTTDQNTDGQRDALIAAGVKDDPRYLFEDHGVSGAKATRPALDKCIASLREGDVLIVAKLDRLGRSLANLIELVKDLGERGVEFRALDNTSIDTTTSNGKLMLNIFGALAEYERDVIRERTNVGLTAAKARGRQGGRPRKLDSDEKVAKAKKMHAANVMAPKEIADALGVSVSTLYRYLAM